MATICAGRANGSRVVNARIARRDLYLSAARAFLFNRELAVRVADDTWRCPDDFGWLPGTHRRPQQTWRDPAFEAWYAGLEKLGVKAMRRPLAVVPEDLQWEAAEDGLLVSFTLPAGTFATSLLRELVDYRIASEIAGGEPRG
ncbi:MAG: tRNA pseudouridine(13) synthase TruD [Gammaproteobacteria bacterium]|nr:tRNA pseudouridine(13) synthase TruD [Gammaproteobacteria bacterium]